MFQFIRRHQAIGLIFIGIVIVSFVIFFSPSQRGRGGAMPRGSLGSISGHPIDRDEYLTALKEARLGYMLREGNWPGRSGRDWDEQQQVFNRLFLLQEAKRLGIQVSDDVAAARIVELGFLRDERTGTFNRAAYDQFLSVLMHEEGISRQDFEQFMRHEVTLQHLVQLAGLSGTLVPPAEAEARYRAANEHFSGLLTIFTASNHLAEVDLSPTNVAQYYSNRLAEYRLPERVQVRYVKFAITNFLADATQQVDAETNLVQLLEAEYQRQGPDKFRDPQGNLLSADAAKAELKDQFRKKLALDAARKKANVFANRLYQLEAKPDSLTQLAAENNLVVEVSPPFDRFRPPLGMGVPATFNQAAFLLSETEPFATPSTGEDGVYVFAFDRRLPSEIQPLEVVHDRVVDSLRRSESRRLAEAEGRRFADSVTNALAEGKSFEAAAAETGLNAITLTNFSRSTVSLPGVPPRLTLAEILRVADDLAPAKVGSFTPAADGGFVFYLAAREPVPADELKRELPDYLKQLRQFGRFSAFMEWEKRRFAAANVHVPGGGNRTNNAATPAPN